MWVPTIYNIIYLDLYESPTKFSPWFCGLVYNDLEEPNWCIIFILSLLPAKYFFKLIAFNYYNLKEIKFIKSVWEMQSFAP